MPSAAIAPTIENKKTRKDSAIEVGRPSIVEPFGGLGDSSLFSQDSPLRRQRGAEKTSFNELGGTLYLEEGRASTVEDLNSNANVQSRIRSLQISISEADEEEEKGESLGIEEEEKRRISELEEEDASRSSFTLSKTAGKGGLDGLVTKVTPGQSSNE